MNENKIESFEDACNFIAKIKGYSNMEDLVELNEDFYIDIILDACKEAAELYAESKASEARGHYQHKSEGIDSDSIINAPAPEYKP